MEHFMDRIGKVGTKNKTLAYFIMFIMNFVLDNNNDDAGYYYNINNIYYGNRKDGIEFHTLLYQFLAHHRVGNRRKGNSIKYEYFLRNPLITSCFMAIFYFHFILFS